MPVSLSPWRHEGSRLTRAIRRRKLTRPIAPICASRAYPSVPQQCRQPSGGVLRPESSNRLDRWPRGWMRCVPPHGRCMTISRRSRWLTISRLTTQRGGATLTIGLTKGRGSSSNSHRLHQGAHQDAHPQSSSPRANAHGRLALPSSPPVHRSQLRSQRCRLHGRRSSRARPPQRQTHRGNQSAPLRGLRRG